MEGRLLHLLNFNLNYPSVNVFLKRYKDIFGLSKALRTLSKKYSYLCLLEYHLAVDRLPSLLAASIIYLCLISHSPLSDYYPDHPSLYDDLLLKTTHSIDHIRPLAKEILCYKAINHSSLLS